MSHNHVQFVCNQDNHSAVKTTSLFLQCMYLVIYACLDRPLTITPNERIQYFTMSTWACTSAKRGGLLADRRVSVKESESKDDSS